MVTVLLTMEEAAARLRKSRRQLEWMIYSRQIRSALIGGRRMFRESDLHAFIEAAFEMQDAA
ncbi:helix-turn-helix domain-containing protein [Agrococcus beijingensis]|uniref:helix-turn-helix domain-containing protein n=1 Tax=Agrococcus beijingensis TaxID=3068634 RepID=UPI002742172A|nr:helix-turn-helix domain-containing protein [Agrococcus sp. REN33]